MTKINHKKYFTELKDTWGGVDKNIIDLVIALNNYGFETIGSCEGHLKDGGPVPYLIIRAYPKDVEYGKKRVTKEEVLYNISRLLDSFYSNRYKENKYKIIAKAGPHLNMITLLNGEKLRQKFLKKIDNKVKKEDRYFYENSGKDYEEIKESLPLLQKEMKDFAKYINTVK